MNIKQYLINDNVSQKINDLSKSFVKLIESMNLSGYYYLGFPIFERQMLKITIPILFLSNKGCHFLVEDEALNEDIDSFIMKTLAENNDLKKLYKQKTFLN